MAERGESIRYAYWSDRRVRSIAEDQGININPRWKTKVTVFKLPLISTGIDFEREPRTLNRRKIAERVERAIGDLAVEDFVTPPSVSYAKGVDYVQFSHFVCDRPDRVVLNIRSHASDGSRVVVCLFGSRDNMTGFVRPYDHHESGWSSSAMWSITDWLATQCTVNDSQWDDPESISVEAMKIAIYQGKNTASEANPDQPWLRGYTIADTAKAEWFAEIYSDVMLTPGRWNLGERVDRILVGAPLWIRTPKADVRRYRDYRRELNNRGPL